MNGCNPTNSNIRIFEPSLALNAVDSPGAPYDMTYNYTVNKGQSPKDIMVKIGEYAGKTKHGYLESLVINCHGGPAEMKLGAGFNLSNTYVFDDLLVEKKPIVGTIYLVVCWVALIWGQDGNIFCCRISKNSGAYVIAPRVWQKPSGTPPPKHYIDKFEETGHMPDGKTKRTLKVVKYTPPYGSVQEWNGVTVPVRV